MDKKAWYIYTMEYYSAIKKNTFELVLMRWMKLELIIQSEVSHKDGNDDPVCERAKETQMCTADFWTLRERERV